MSTLGRQQVLEQFVRQASGSVRTAHPVVGDLELEEPGQKRRSSHGRSFPCLRINGVFYACVKRSTGNLIVKPSADRVTELVASDVGIPFAPHGTAFREWVAFPVPGEDELADLPAEAPAFVDG